MRYTVKNWQRFQHYSGRRPPWIKLYRDLLDDFEFMSLSLASKALAPLIWLLASESDDGSFDGEIDRLAFRLRIDSKTLATALKELTQKGFVSCASNALADCQQVATPETERDTETDTERSRFELPDWVPSEAWGAWLEVRKRARAPNTTRALRLAVKELGELVAKGQDAEAVLNQSTMRGWRGLFPVGDRGRESPLYSRQGVM